MASCMQIVSGSTFVKYSGLSNQRRRGRNHRVFYSVLSPAEQYKILGLQLDSSKKEVKKAFRRLALKYHPDVCKGSNCGLQFHLINEAYEMVMSNLKESEEYKSQPFNYSGNDYTDGCDEPEMHDSLWDTWEEWMGWEGAWICDYSSKINPSI